MFSCASSEHENEKKSTKPKSDLKFVRVTCTRNSRNSLGVERLKIKITRSRDNQVFSYFAERQDRSSTGKFDDYRPLRYESDAA